MSSNVAVPMASTGARAPERIEIITGHERRSSYSDEDKARLVAEAGMPGQTVAVVGRRHGVCPSLLYRWRRAGYGGGGPAMPRLLPVRLVPPGPAETSPMPSSASVAPTHSAAGLVEITLPNGCRVRVDQHVDARALRRILSVLTVGPAGPLAGR